MTTPCTASPDLWFSEHPEDSEAAKDACLDCPVMLGCAEKGLSEEHGVWGGLDPAERGAVLERRFGVVPPPARRVPRAGRPVYLWSEEQLAQITAWRAEGLSGPAMARRIGTVSPRTVQRLLKAQVA